jgi:hypothetical protein
MKTTQLPACLAAVVLLSQDAFFRLQHHEDALPFEELSLHLEVDLPAIDLSGAPRWVASRPAMLDLPAEIVLEVASEKGLRELCLFLPSGQPALDLVSPSAQLLGASEVVLECDGAALRDALREYRAGEYIVCGTALDGTRLQGIATLRHRLPGLFAVQSPAPRAVLAGDVTMAWTASHGAARYGLEIEQEETGFCLELTLPADRRSITIPRELLPPDGRCEYSLWVQGDTDNELELEGEFTLVAR